MSIYWFTRWICHELKKSVYKMFIWRLPNPELHRKNNPSYAHHINPHLLGWIGVFIIVYGLWKQWNFTIMFTGLGVVIFAYLLRLYWKGKWRTYKKRMEAKE